MTSTEIEKLADKLIKALEERGTPNTWHNPTSINYLTGAVGMVEVHETYPVAQRRAIMEVLRKELLK